MDADASLPKPRYKPRESPPGIRFVDPIDGGQFSLFTEEPFAPIERSTDALPIPLDTAIEIEPDTFQTPYLVGVWIRDSEFTLVDQCTGGDTVSLEDGEYIVEFSAVQLKVYLGIDGPFEIDATGDAVTFSTEQASDVVLGVRSYHEQPARTITTTTDPRDLMHAISQFRASLMTTSPERSFPTLRGHPPLLELGEELSIPAGSALSEPSVFIEVPVRWDRILPVTSLSYYLDAAVVPGREPRLVVDGEQFPLVGPEGFEQRVEAILKHVFTLDCITRTEGLYDVELHERTLIEEHVDLDFAELYDAPIADRIAAYMDVPFDVVEPAVPEWKLTADVEPDPNNIPVLPFLASDLAVIRVPRNQDIETRIIEDTTPDVEAFFREDPVLVRGQPTADRTTSTTDSETISDRVFRPEPTESLMQTFVGDGIPMGATKMTPTAFRRRLEYEPAEPGRIQVDVVNNEDAMSEESAVSDVYGTREWIDFDISVHTELTKAELTDVLKQETDFFHYIGHVEDEGFRCADGHLDAETLSDVNIGAFLLNACKSYDQGQALVDAGALGGIVTLATIPNPTATEVGKNVAKLLNTGFSIANARSLLEEDEQLASRYMVVGDGHANVVESKAGSPASIQVKSASNTAVKVEFQGYPSPAHSVGGLRSWNVEMPVSNCIETTRIPHIEIQRDEFESLCRMDQIPILSDNELQWSGEVDLTQI
ncbi:hypothetical protein [Halorhabdus salina]|uniref:hypothetical protein n=1 Tax=Halorhabdus salina TaxID=2750670 RepID=UPI0015EF9214|nr:hypothetical protein [Halorhabdus salina]